MAQLLMNFDKVNGRLLQSIILTRSLFTLTPSDNPYLVNYPHPPTPPKKEILVYKVYHFITVFSLQFSLHCHGHFLSLRLFFFFEFEPWFFFQFEESVIYYSTLKSLFVNNVLFQDLNSQRITGSSLPLVLLVIWQTIKFTLNQIWLADQVLMKCNDNTNDAHIFSSFWYDVKLH